MNYWNNFYGNLHNGELSDPSDFCIFVMNYFENDQNIINVMDAGCGNGRDSYTLAKRYTVTGIDNSGYTPIDVKNCIFKHGDFIEYDKTEFDLIYSRFTFHSITNSQHEVFLKSIKKNTYLCIETRSDKSSNKDTYYGDSHYRNNTNLKYLENLLKNCDFEIMFIEEGLNMAIYKNENPYCIRSISKKL
jgi:hypothetical protein